MASATEVKHTPAPWLYVHEGSETRFIDGQTSRTVVDLSPMTDDAETEANAHLIAAAPDLLEALEDSLVEGHHALCPGRPSIGGFKCSTRCTGIRTALAHARGER